MGKNPAFQYYPSDFDRDTKRLPLFARGAWISILNSLWFSTTRGRMCLNWEEWGREIAAPLEEVQEAVGLLIRHKIGEIGVDDRGNVTIISRRMERDEKERQRWR